MRRPRHPKRGCWAIGKKRWVICYRRFGTTYPSHLEGSSSPRRAKISFTPRGKPEITHNLWIFRGILMFKKISLIAYLITVAPCTCTSWNHLMTWKLNSRELEFTFHIIIVVVKEDNNKGPYCRRYSPHHVECKILLGCDTIQSSSNLQMFRGGGPVVFSQLFYPEDGGRIFHQYGNVFIPDYMASHPRKLLFMVAAVRTPNLISAHHA
jgi:hypothetical protein